MFVHSFVIYQARIAITKKPSPTESSQVRVRVNEKIRTATVRVIDEEGKQVGVMPPQEALALAREKNLDLVEVAPNAEPPVVRFMDFGKYRYEQAKRDRQARKAQKQIEVKEVRLRPKTGEHDTEVRLRQARKFLESGAKVKVRVRFRGREIYHPQVAREILAEFAERVSDISEVEVQPDMEGRSLLMILTPSRGGGAKPQRTEAPTPAPSPES